MRCNNCGWVNPVDAQFCSKCNSKLAAGPDSGTRQDGNAGIPLNKTMKGDSPSLPYYDTPPVPGEGQRAGNMGPEVSLKCRNCGYPLREGATTCPNCHLAVDEAHSIHVKPSGNGIPGAGIHGTIDPYAGHKPPRFFLLPYSGDEESNETKLEFSGHDIVLNRDNLHPGNMTITSGEQAKLREENGKWFIVDKSSKKTTFKQVGEEIEIKKGDILLMGDRRFIFDL
jgi:hypothetical protein